LPDYGVSEFKASLQELLIAKVEDMHDYLIIGNIMAGFDFLRSRGYLIEWNGLTEQEIIDYGWAKTIK
jgi:hypothetical protein